MPNLPNMQRPTMDVQIHSKPSTMSLGGGNVGGVFDFPDSEVDGSWNGWLLSNWGNEIPGLNEQVDLSGIAGYPFSITYHHFGSEIGSQHLGWLLSIWGDSAQDGANFMDSAFYDFPPGIDNLRILFRQPAPAGSFGGALGDDPSSIANSFYNLQLYWNPDFGGWCLIGVANSVDQGNGSAAYDIPMIIGTWQIFSDPLNGAWQWNAQPIPPEFWDPYRPFQG